MLHGKHLDVSYFAAGILAHLCSDGDSAWRSIAGLDRYDILEDLVRPMKNVFYQNVCECVCRNNRSCQQSQLALMVPSHHGFFSHGIVCPCSCFHFSSALCLVLFYLYCFLFCFFCHLSGVQI